MRSSNPSSADITGTRLGYVRLCLNKHTNIKDCVLCPGYREAQLWITWFLAETNSLEWAFFCVWVFGFSHWVDGKRAQRSMPFCSPPLYLLVHPDLGLLSTPNGLPHW